MVAMAWKIQDQEFKTTRINLLRALKEKVAWKTGGQCKQYSENSKKEPKRNARDQKHCNENEENLSWSSERTGES